MAELFQTNLRELTGSANARRLRRAGDIPVILYGHEKETISLSVPSVQVQSVVQKREKLVKLEGAVTENALIKAVQWDALGSTVTHLDLTRVHEDETVEVTVIIVVKGVAAGVAQGGRVNRTLRRIQILCPVMNIPSELELNISELELNGALTIADLELPPDVKPIDSPETVVATCTEIVIVEEPVDGEIDEDGEGEPELIGAEDQDDVDEAADSDNDEPAPSDEEAGGDE